MCLLKGPNTSERPQDGLTSPPSEDNYPHNVAQIVATNGPQNRMCLGYKVTNMLYQTHPRCDKNMRFLPNVRRPRTIDAVSGGSLP